MDTLSREVNEILRIPDEMEKMLRPQERAYVKNTKAMFRTPADIYDHPDSYHFILDMPGLQVEKIKVKVENGVLHVAGKINKKKRFEVGEGVKPIRVERRRARYMRKFTLPEDADTDKVNATYKDGVLTVVVGKKQTEEEEEKPKKISIPIS